MNILFFDYWTKGIHNFLPLEIGLTAIGAHCKLLHLGSWRDASVPAREVLYGIDCEDIGVYRGSIRLALQSLRPQVVVMLNTTMTMDRTVNRICRQMGIRTVYLMHGIKAVGADLDEFVAHQNTHWTFAKRLGKIGKYAGLCTGYLGAIARHRPLELLQPRTYGHFVQMALWPGASHERPWPHQDIYCDRALVYANVYRDSMCRETGYPLARVAVVGNPNLDAAFALARDAGAQERSCLLVESLGVAKGRRAVVYMEDAFVEQGIGGWTEQTRLDELRAVATAVHAAGFDLIIKMHPGSNARAVLQEFSGQAHTHVVLKTDLALLMYGCVATIGHISTTLMFPIVFGRPVVVPSWSPGLERLGYYVAAGAALAVETPQALTHWLESVDAPVGLSRARMEKFVSDYITQTDGRSQERIVSEIVGLAKQTGVSNESVAA